MTMSDPRLLPPTSEAEAWRKESRNSAFTDWEMVTVR